MAEIGVMSLDDLEAVMRDLRETAARQLTTHGQAPGALVVVRDDGKQAVFGIPPAPNHSAFQTLVRLMAQLAAISPRTVALVLVTEAWARNELDDPAADRAFRQGREVKDMPDRREVLLLHGACRAGEMTLQGPMIRDEGQPIRFGEWERYRTGGEGEGCRSVFFTGLAWGDVAPGAKA